MEERPAVGAEGRATEQRGGDPQRAGVLAPEDHREIEAEVLPAAPAGALGENDLGPGEEDDPSRRGFEGEGAAEDVAEGGGVEGGFQPGFARFVRELAPPGDVHEGFVFGVEAPFEDGQIRHLVALDDMERGHGVPVADLEEGLGLVGIPERLGDGDLEGVGFVVEGPRGAPEAGFREPTKEVAPERGERLLGAGRDGEGLGVFGGEVALEEFGDVVGAEEVTDVVEAGQI